jgi:hypothetical protein
MDCLIAKAIRFPILAKRSSMAKHFFRQKPSQFDAASYLPMAENAENPAKMGFPHFQHFRPVHRFDANWSKRFKPGNRDSARTFAFPSISPGICP